MAKFFVELYEYKYIVYKFKNGRIGQTIKQALFKLCLKIIQASFTSELNTQETAIAIN